MKFLSFFEHPNINANNRTEVIVTMVVVIRRSKDASMLVMIINDGNTEAKDTNITLKTTLCINLLNGNATMRFNIKSRKNKHPMATQIDTTKVYSGVAPNFNNRYDNGKLSI